MAHGRYSLNVGGMNEFLRGCHLFNKPFFCSPLQHNFVGLLCYKTSVARREREGEWCRKASLLQREADVSVYWLMASACGKMFYRAGCCVSNKNASPLSEMPEVQRCLGIFQGKWRIPLSIAWTLLDIFMSDTAKYQRSAAFTVTVQGRGGD